MNSIDIGRAIKAPFTDKDWIKKTLLGYLWTILIVTGPAVFGMQIEYIKRAAEGRDELPEWTEFGEKWVKGLLAVVAGFIYFLPVILGAIISVVPVAVSAAADNRVSPAGVGVLVLFGLLALVYGLAVTLFFYAALTHYAMTDRFGAFFEFREIFKRLRTGGYFTAWLFSWVISIGASAVTSVLARVLLGVGALLSPAVTFLSAMMTGNVLGQYAAHAYGVARAPVPTTVPPTYPTYPPPTAPPAYVPPTAPPAYTPPTAPPQQPVYAPPPPAQPPVYTPPAPPSPPAEHTPPTPPPPKYTPPAPPAYTPPAQPEYTPPAAPPDYAPPAEPPAPPPPAEPAPPAPPAAPPES